MWDDSQARAASDAQKSIERSSASEDEEDDEEEKVPILPFIRKTSPRNSFCMRIDRL